MISFDLKCAHGHVFEAWFRSSTDYETQQNAALIACPLCGDCEIGKAIMAPAVTAKGNRRPDVSGHAAPANTASSPAGTGLKGPMPSEKAMRAALGAIAAAQASMLEQSEWVGDRFADRARAIYYGEADAALIHGTTNVEEARAMLEEGLPVAPLIVPVAPPDRLQ